MEGKLGRSSSMSRMPRMSALGLDLDLDLAMTNSGDRDVGAGTNVTSSVSLQF